MKTVRLLAIVVVAAWLAMGCQKAADVSTAKPSLAAVKAKAPPAAKPGDAAKMGEPTKTTESAPKAAAGTSDGISWVGYEEALKRARSEKKLMMVDFTAEWCSWCKKLEKDVYTKPDVRAKIDQFIPVLVDVDKQQDLAKQYGVEGMPYIAVVDADGNVLADQKGYCEAPAFAAFLDKGLAAKSK
jgi:thiol:disulfide interchange protein